MGRGTTRLPPTATGTTRTRSAAAGSTTTTGSTATARSMAHRGYTRTSSTARPGDDASSGEYDGATDITQWLSSEERSQKRKEDERSAKLGISAVEDRLEPRWVLEFNAKPGGLTDIRGGQPMTHMEECWWLCQRMLQMGLTITHHARNNNSRLVITVGANTQELRKEAARVKLPMRMQDTMGMVPFTEQPAEAALKALILDTMNARHLDDAKRRQIEADCTDIARKDGAIGLAGKARAVGCARAEIEEALHGGGVYVHTPNGTLFNSAQEQQLVMSLMNKGLLIPLEARLQLPTRGDTLHKLSYMLATSRPISAKFLAQTLTSFGAYVVDSRGRFTQAERIGPMCAKVAAVTEIDRDADGGGPWFIVKNPAAPTFKGLDAFEEKVKKALGFGGTHSLVRQERDLQRLQALRLQAHNDQVGVEYTPVAWGDLQELCRELTKWRQGAGKQQRFANTLLSFYPTHDYTELKFFQRRWATLNVVLDFRVRMRDNENTRTEGALYNPNSVVNFNPSRQPKQWMLWFQPVDEIRDYFGDEVGLYFAWLGVYTRSLAFSSIFGLLSMLYGVINSGSADPDRNDFTLLYSVFVAVWSVMFLQRWQRREHELNFLWGTEKFADSQEPRTEFQGRPKVVGFPGKETWVPSGIIWPLLQRCISWGLIILIMAATITVALIAEGLSSNRREWWEKFDLEAPGNNDGYIDVHELARIGEALQKKHKSFLGVGETVEAWADRLMYENQTGWLVPDREEPVCSIMQGQCTVSNDPEEDNCDRWVEEGHCITHFNATLGVDIEPDPSVVNFGAAWRASEYKSYKVSAPPIIPWLRENSWVVVAAFFNLFFLQLFAYILCVAISCNNASVLLAFALSRCNAYRATLLWRCSKKMATRLNHFENHRLQSAHNRHLVIKLFAFAFINNYFVLFYVAYFRHMEILPQVTVPDFLGGGSFQLQRPLKCDQSCMSDLQLKLFIVFTGKTYGMKVLELGVPLINRCKQSKKSLGDDDGEQQGALRAQTTAGSNVQKDSKRAQWKGIDQDFAQMVTQFGYLALFAPACSLAPLLAFVNNVTEIRSDAWKICNLFQRPIAKRVQSIGAWADVLKTLALAAVVVNTTMVFFVGSQMACPHDDRYVKEMMELKRTNADAYEDLENADRPTFAERQMDGLLCSTWSSPSSSVRQSGSGDMLELDGVAYRVTVSRLWVLALILEHFVLMLRFSMGSFLPTVPHWLETARDTLSFKEKIIEGSSDGLLKATIASTLKMVRRMGADHPEEVFDLMDLDNDGLLTPKEIGRCCKYMGMDISDEQELMDIVRKIDGDGDNLVDKEEFSVFWQENGGKNKFQLRDSDAVFRKYDTDGSGSLESSELVRVCQELGMHKLSDKQQELLMQELDADGDNSVDAEEFKMWWEDNGGEKFRPRAPPGPGDMSRRRRFETRKLENAKRRAGAASSAVADGMARLNGMDELDDNNQPPAAARRPPVATDGSVSHRSRAQHQQQAIGATFEIERQHTNLDDDTLEIHLNPLSGEQRHLGARQAAPANLDQSRANGHGWATLRTGQQQHALLDGPKDASYIARRAAAVLKPMPLKVDHARLTRDQLKKANHAAALDRRVERLLMGSGAEISHQASAGVGASGLPTTAAATLPPAVAPRPSMASARGQVTGSASHSRTGGNHSTSSPARRRPPPVADMAASVGVAAGGTGPSSGTRRRPPPLVAANGSRAAVATERSSLGRF